MQKHIQHITKEIRDHYLHFCLKKTNPNYGVPSRRKPTVGNVKTKNKLFFTVHLTSFTRRKHSLLTQSQLVATGQCFYTTNHYEIFEDNYGMREDGWTGFYVYQERNASGTHYFK